MLSTFNFQELTSAFIVLFAVIDIIGSIPIILNLKQNGRDVNAIQATLISFALLIGFFYAGDMVLKLFQVDIASFAVAGSVVLFLLALEMILDVEIFKNQGPIKEATLVPLVFPLLAGAGSFTTLLSLRAEYAPLNIVIALVLNMVWVYIVLKSTNAVERKLGKGGIYLIRKFFGIILLAIAARLFTANITLLIDQFICYQMKSAVCGLPTPREASGPEERATTLQPFLKTISLELHVLKMIFLFLGGAKGSSPISINSSPHIHKGNCITKSLTFTNIC